MSIVALAQTGALIVAATSQGQLIAWPLPSLHQKFPSNVALVPQALRIQVDPNVLNGVATNEELIIAFNGTHIYQAPLLSLNSLKSSIVFNSIAASQLLLPNENISCLTTAASRTIIGGSMGTLILLDEELKAIRSTKIQSPPSSSNQLAQSPPSPPQVNDIIPYSGGGLILAGLSDGTISTISLSNMQTMLTLKGNTELEPISKLKIDQSMGKIYALHCHYISVWSLQTCTCQGVIECHNCTDAAVYKKQLLVVGSHSKLLSVQEEGGCDLSMRSSGAIVELKDGRLAVGGSELMVDILVGRMRQASLICQ